VDHRTIFEDVCAALERAGFELAAPGQAGLYVRHLPRGVVVGWRPDVPAASTARTEPVPDVVKAVAQYQRMRHAVTFALSAILEQAGFCVTNDGDDQDLQVTGRHSDAATTAAADR
jgi:hypothetical protein